MIDFTSTTIGGLQIASAHHRGASLLAGGRATPHENPRPVAVFPQPNDGGRFVPDSSGAFRLSNSPRCWVAGVGVASSSCLAPPKPFEGEVRNV